MGRAGKILAAIDRWSVGQDKWRLLTSTACREEKAVICPVADFASGVYSRAQYPVRLLAARTESVHNLRKTLIFVQNASSFWSMINNSANSVSAAIWSTHSNSASILRSKITPSHQQGIPQVKTVNTRRKSTSGDEYIYIYILYMYIFGKSHFVCHDVRHSRNNKIKIRRKL